MTENIKPEFVDTNILVYAYDSAVGERHVLAKYFLKQIWERGCGCVSTQILQEFYVSVTRKAKKPLSEADAQQAIRDLSVWTVHRPSVDDILAATVILLRYQISFWDALVIRSAQQTGCEILWSEDLSDGQEYNGIRVTNPFKS
jgi:predicted nucleic acid-binding protein